MTNARPFDTPHLMLRAFAFVLILFSFSPVFAVEERPMAWTCSMTVRMNGVLNHFVLYGRDSWTGTSTLFCQLGRTTHIRKVTMTFNGFGDGFGADARSELTLTVSLSTSTKPDSLQIRAFVVNSNTTTPGVAVRWTFASRLTGGTIVVNRVDESRVTRSLQRGTLYLRGALE